MKSPLAIAAVLSLFFSSAALAVTAEECQKHVEENFDTFSVCYHSGTTGWNGREIVNFSVKSCEKGEGVWVCHAEHEPWPSSDCEMKIVLDEHCYYNISTTITREGREDM